MLNPLHLRPYIGHDVRVETDLSIVEGTLTDVDRRALHVIDVNIGWQNFAAMTLDISSIRSVASERCPHNVELVVGIGLSHPLGQVGIEAFTQLREKLACWVKLPSIRARDNLFLEPYAFSIRCGRVIIAEGEARSVEELSVAIENFFNPEPVDNSGETSKECDRS